MPKHTKSAISAATYRKLRRQVGSQAKVSELIGVDLGTLSRRERGAIPISKEAELALRYVVLQRGDGRTNW